MIAYIKENRNFLEKLIKWSCFGILLIVATMIIWAMILENLQNGNAITTRIYDYNCTLCVVSILLHIFYLFVHYVGKRKEEIKQSIKNFFKKEWPCLLLVIFMAWTAVGCLGAAIEAKAEANIKEAYVDYQNGIIKNKDELYETTKKDMEIANWSSGYRATNAADRSWNGCTNLKDGYFSFLFYATIVTNIILLGYQSRNMKKWILRMMMLVMIAIAFFTLLNYCNSGFMSSIMPYRRAIFHNSNHYGYYLSIAVILCATMCLKEENLYFKFMAGIGYLVTLYIAVLNNTFGSYLGILTAMICLFIYTFIRYIACMIQKKEKKGKEIFELVATTIMGIALVICSLTIYEKTADGENKEDSIVVTNFKEVFEDIGVWLGSGNEETIANEETNIEEKSLKETSISDAIAQTGSGRGEVWLGVFKLIKQKPFFGWGLENLLQAFYDQLHINEGRTHNLILQLMGTTGIPGMLLYMVGVLGIFFRHFNPKRWKEWNSLEYVTIFCFISYMVSSMFGNSAFYTSPYFMIILGILLTSTWEKKGEVKK